MMIRRLTLSDFDALARLSHDTFVAAFAAQNNPTDFKIYVERAFAPATLAAELINTNNAFFFIENDTDAEPLGYMKINLREKPHDILPESRIQNIDFESLTMMELARIYVRENYHGKGIAQKLMEHALELANTEGVEMLWLGVLGT
ncbi:MAG: GNAT family N-acetyltransferase [Saprospiraceae bacterium]|nr:GNAT family N-acetyltransferase [Saprospiraceae bacterium]